MNPLSHTPAPLPGTHASTQLLRTSHLIPRRPPFHPIHSHRDICERIYYTKQDASKIQCQNTSVFQGLGRDLLKPHPNNSQAVGLGALALSPQRPPTRQRRMKTRYRSIKCGSREVGQALEPVKMGRLLLGKARPMPGEVTHKSSIATKGMEPFKIGMRKKLPNKCQP